MNPHYIPGSIQSYASSTLSGALTPNYTPGSPKIQDALQSIVQNRKSWKTAAGGGEVVWPLTLEVTLLEGLSVYEPGDSLATRLLGRHPRRNRFLSDFIFDRTGIRRTPKQVGSRLQQLQGACGKQLRMLLSPAQPTAGDPQNNYSAPADYYTDDSSDSSSMPSSPSDAITNCRYASSSQSRIMIAIDILPPPQHSPTRSNMHSNWVDTDDHVVHLTSYARPLHSIDPRATFIAPSNISAESSQVVYSAGIEVWSETTQLNAVGLAPGRTDGAFLYSTTLVPGFWSKIVESPYPTQFTIVQDIISNASETPLFSAMYKFIYPSCKPTSPSTTGYNDEKLLHDVQEVIPMNNLYVMDTYPGSGVHTSYHNSSPTHTSTQSGSRSPSELSGYQNSDEEVVPSPHFGTWSERYPSQY